MELGSNLFALACHPALQPNTRVDRYMTCISDKLRYTTGSFVTYLQLAYLHLATVLPALVLGTYLLCSRKESDIYKKLGRIYLSLILTSAVLALFMSAQVGPTVFGHFSFIHLFSVLVLILVPSAYHAARTGNVRRHRNNMIGLYVGGLLVAGSFAFSPGRFLHQWLFGSL